MKNTSPFLISEDGTVPSLTKPVTEPLLKVGDVLVSCWGYEASIASWYRVEAVNAKTVMLSELPAINYDYHTGGMYWTSKPDLSHNVKRTFSKKLRDGKWVKINSYSSAHKWSGEPIECYNVH